MSPPLADVDPEPTPAERAAAEALIAMERSTIPDDSHHALLAPPINSQFSSLIQSELDRLASVTTDSSSSSNNNNNNNNSSRHPQPLQAIDLTRYEAPDLPHGGAAPTRDQLEPALAQAYTAMTYLSARRQHLALLDSHGKNAWLVGNWQLEAELRAVERDLADARREVDLLTLRRQRAQADVAAELRGLDDGWRRGVGRVLEAEVAAEGLRRDVREAERARARG